MAKENKATVNAATAKPGSGDTKGIVSNERSLTLQNAPEKSASEIAMEAEEALQRQQTELTKRVERIGSEESTESESAEGDESTESTETETAESNQDSTESNEGGENEEGESNESNADDDPDDVVDQKGRVFVRPKRFKKLLQESNQYRRIVEKLANKSLDDESSQETTSRTEKAADPITEATTRVTNAETALNKAYEAIEKAQDAFDKKAENEANRARDKAIRELADAEADLKITKSQARDVERNSQTQWQRDVDSSERQFKAVRDELWNEDAARLLKVDPGNPDLDLGDENSWIHQEVSKQINKWKREGNPIMLKPAAYRRAVELVTDTYDINLPAVTPKVKPVTKQVQSVKSNTVVHRKNATVIAKNSQGGKAPITEEQLIQKIQSMPADEQLRFLAGIQELQTKGR